MAEITAQGLIQLHGGPVGATAALRGLDLEIDRGSIVAIVGPSGSGKSTLLRLLAGIERPSAGSLEVLGLALDRASEDELRRFRNESVALVEQHYRRALSPYLPSREQVALPLLVRGWTKGRADERVQSLLERLGVAHRAGATPARLSGGEQQRVAVAAALSHRPRLLLADEPTGELDRITGDALLETLREVVRVEGATCVIVTHDEAVERIADAVLFMQDGRVVAERVGSTMTPTIDRAGWRAPLPSEPPARLTAVPRRLEGHPAVRLEQVERRYGDGDGATGLPVTSATIASGGLHAVVGPSGSGKSTLLRLIGGLDRPTSGSVWTLGVQVDGLDREELARFRAQHLALVDQSRPLVPFLTVAENVELGLAICGIEGSECGQRAASALERLGIAHLGGRRPQELSAGERTRASIARAVAAEPQLLLLDEPTATLDRGTAELIARLLVELSDMTVVAATHDPALIEVCSDQLVLSSRVPPVDTPAARIA